MDVVQWIRDGLTKPGKQKQELAKALSVPRSSITELLAGRRNLLASEIGPAAAYLEVEPPAFHRSRFVPLMGKAAGDSFDTGILQDSDDPIDWISVTPGDDLSKYALEVVGGSMRGIANEGWLVFFGEPHSPPTQDQVGELCVCRLASGQTVIKFLQESRYEGLYDLESVEGIQRAQEVQWAAVVETIATARQAARLLRVNEMTDNPNFLKIQKPA